MLVSAQIHTFPFLIFSRFLTTSPSFLLRTYGHLSSFQQIPTDLQDPASLNSCRQQPQTAHTVIASYSDYFYSFMYLWILILICQIFSITKLLKGKWPKEGKRKRSWGHWRTQKIYSARMKQIQIQPKEKKTQQNPNKAKTPNNQTTSKSHTESNTVA